MKISFRFGFAAVWLVCVISSLRSCVWAAAPDLSAITPNADADFTATRQINALAVAPDGSLWAATAGGILRRSSDGMWRKWTRAEGLPSVEARDVVLENDGAAHVEFPLAQAVYRQEKWQVEAHPAAQSPLMARSVVWNGATWTATLSGLKREASGEKTRLIQLPPSTGTHISALLERPKVLWAALFGDGLWQFDGAQWHRAPIEIPSAAREITALAGDAQSVYLGTRRDGIWGYDGAGWKNVAPLDEPFDHNVQNMIAFAGALWCSTLEDGLVARTAEGWKHFGEPLISSNAPRQMAVFNGALWVRHGGGMVDRFDGKQWTKNVFAKLPRGKTMAMAADDKRLYLAQWGGWSEWDGAHLQHFLKWPLLQGVPPMTLHAQGQTLWIGTQSRGLIAAQRTPQSVSNAPSISLASSSLPSSPPQWNYRLRVYDERQSLPDDWITALAQTGQTLCAGTFVGGLACFDGARWQSPPELKGQNVTALQADGKALWIATRAGLWHRAADGTLIDIGARLPWLDRELQALCVSPGGLWVGARTGISFLSRATLQRIVG